MMNLSVQVAVTLALSLATHSLLVQAVAIGNLSKNPAVRSSSEANSAVALFNRFEKCKLKPNPKPRDLIAHRLCIKRILEKEGGTGEGGRWGRSVDGKLRRQMAKIEDILLIHEGIVKHHLVRSLEVLCAGDYSHFEHDIKEYIQWRCENGYGDLMRRWGRSSPASSTIMGSGQWNKIPKDSKKRVDYLGSDDGNGRLVKRYDMFYKGLTKRDNADDMKAIVQAYREWRSQNGYSQTSGRWG